MPFIIRLSFVISYSLLVICLSFIVRVLFVISYSFIVYCSLLVIHLSFILRSLLLFQSIIYLQLITTVVSIIKWII